MDSSSDYIKPFDGDQETELYIISTKALWNKFTYRLIITSYISGNYQL